MKHTKKALFISPHLDDVVLSSSSLLLNLKKLGWDVSVVTIFTKFPDKDIAEYSKEFLERSNAKNGQELELTRKKEDATAFKLLGVSKLIYWNFTDAGFRTKNNQPVYKSFKELFSKQKKELELEKKIAKKLEEFNRVENPNIIIAPFGIGNHIDHKLIKKIVTNANYREKVCFYLEYPYYYNYKASFIQKIKLKSKYLIWTNKKPSQKKITAIKKYTSQINQLFKNRSIIYPEHILFQI